jgi:hypothetical protein
MNIIDAKLNEPKFKKVRLIRVLRLEILTHHLILPQIYLLNNSGQC